MESRRRQEFFIFFLYFSVCVYVCVCTFIYLWLVEKRRRKRNRQNERAAAGVMVELVFMLVEHSNPLLPPSTFLSKKLREGKKERKKRADGAGLLSWVFRHTHTHRVPQSKQGPVGCCGSSLSLSLFFRACLRGWCHRISLLPNAGQTGHVSSSVFLLSFFNSSCWIIFILFK